MRILLAMLLFAAPLTSQSVWSPLKFLEGSWQGTGKGKPGVSTMERTYEFILNGRFLSARNKSVYAPQEANPKGEVHEDRGVFSFDRGRKRFVLRQFHVEGFVNTYASEEGKPLVFTSEAIENIPSGWRARETYTILGPDEFTETFELAEPGKEFEVYSVARLRRKK